MTRLRLPVFVGFVLAALVGLHLAGSGALAGPASVGAWPGWLGRPDPVLTVFALVRLVALGIGWYLLVITMAGAALRWCRAPRLVAVCDAFTLPGLRRLLDGCCGAALIAATCLPAGVVWAAAPASAAVPVSAAAPPSPPPVLHWLGTLGPVGASAPSAPTGPVSSAPLPQPPPPPAPAGPAAVSAAGPAAVGPSPSTTAPPPAAAPASTPAAPATPTRPRAEPASVTSGGAAPAAPSVAPPADAGPVQPGTWTVRPGDNLWAIARVTLAAARGRAVTDAETAGYWTELLAANRSRLVHTAEPGLIYAGQIFVLPPVPPVPPPIF